MLAEDVNDEATPVLRCRIMCEHNALEVLFVRSLTSIPLRDFGHLTTILVQIHHKRDDKRAASPSERDAENKISKIHAG